MNEHKRQELEKIRDTIKKLEKERARLYQEHIQGLDDAKLKAIKDHGIEEKDKKINELKNQLERENTGIKLGSSKREHQYVVIEYNKKEIAIRRTQGYEGHPAIKALYKEKKLGDSSKDKQAKKKLIAEKSKPESAIDANIELFGFKGGKLQPIKREA
jgi:hypothetical protein